MSAVVTIPRLYERLMAEYGPQGWWPLLGHAGTNPTKSGAVRGYHPGDYSFPRTDDERFEICVGAVLTQNTAWPNVERALASLASLNALTPDRMLDLDEGILRQAIRPSGYFNVKARKLRCLAEFCAGLGGRVPRRDELLAVWGIGPETADSILLYACKQPECVIDAYTRRVFAHLGIADPAASYDDLKALCERQLPRDVPVYQEFHGLLVEHAKRVYARKPYRDGVVRGNGG